MPLGNARSLGEQEKQRSLTLRIHLKLLVKFGKITRHRLENEKLEMT